MRRWIGDIATMAQNALHIVSMPHRQPLGTDTCSYRHHIMPNTSFGGVDVYSVSNHVLGTGQAPKPDAIKQIGDTAQRAATVF